MNQNRINNRFENQNGPIVKIWTETSYSSGIDISVIMVEHANGFKRVYSVKE